MKPLAYSPQQGFHSEQPYRDYDHPPSRYDVSSGGAYPDPKYRNYDSSSPFENNLPQYDTQWNPYNPPLSPSNSHGYDPHSPYGDGSDSHYTPPLRYDEPPPQQGFDGRPRYGKPTNAVRYEDPSPPAAGPELNYQDSHLSAYPSGARTSEHAGQRPAYNQGPAAQHKSYKPQQYDPAPVNSDSPTPPPKAEAPSPPFLDAPKPLPARDEEPDDPAMRPQSVLTRVKMFENKRSVSVDRARDATESTGNKVVCFWSRYLTGLHQWFHSPSFFFSLLQAADLPLKTGGVIPKANSLSNLDQEKSYR